MRISPARYRLITVIALGLLITIVVSGAAVRLTGSGLGCDDWPNCNDAQLIDVSSNHAAIEQVNRLFTGLVAVAVIAAVLGSLWRTPRRRDLTWLSLGLVAGVLGQIVLGGITVLVDLHPLAVQSHMLLSMVLVATAVVLVRRAGEPDGSVRRYAVGETSRRLVWAIATATGVAIIAGTVVTGAGPHAGSEDVQRFDVAIHSAARVHGATVLLAIGLAVVLAVHLQRRPGRPAGPPGHRVVVDLHRPAAGGDRVHPVLQRRARAARRAARRRRDRPVVDDGVARAEHVHRRRPWSHRMEAWSRQVLYPLAPHERATRSGATSRTYRRAARRRRLRGGVAGGHGAQGRGADAGSDDVRGGCRRSGPRAEPVQRRRRRRLARADRGRRGLRRRRRRQRGRAGDDRRATGIVLICLGERGDYTVTLVEDTLPDGFALAGESEFTLDESSFTTSIRSLNFFTGESSRTSLTFFEKLAQRTVDGLRLGFIIAITSVGLSLIFGTTGLTNFAHGELVTFGAMMAYLFGETLEIPFGIAAVIAVALGGLLGFVLNEGLFAPLRRRGTGLVSQMVITVGLAILMRNIFLFQFGGDFRFLSDYNSQIAWDLGPIAVTARDFTITVLSAIVLVTVALVLQRTRLGKATRAVSDNGDLASATGIDTAKIIRLVWISGAALAALGGIFRGLGRGHQPGHGWQPPAS